MTFQRTRLAPTPSGFLHLGNILSFATTATLAREHNARIMLRIDDIDQQRVNPDYLLDIFETLQFLGIPWDEGPRGIEEFGNDYSQVKRLYIYRQALEHLVSAGQVFACDCSRAAIIRQHGKADYPGTCRNRKIPLDQPDVNWRLRTPPSLPAPMQDYIIRKRDGLPAYQLTSVCDDLHFEVDCIVRGEDLWPSTQAQLYLSGLLPPNHFRDTIFYHHTLLPDANGQKLSKSRGATSIQSLRRAGLSPEQIYTCIASLLPLSQTRRSANPPKSFEDLADRIIDSTLLRTGS